MTRNQHLYIIILCLSYYFLAYKVPLAFSVYGDVTLTLLISFFINLLFFTVLLSVPSLKVKFVALYQENNLKELSHFQAAVRLAFDASIWMLVLYCMTYFINMINNVETNLDHLEFIKFYISCYITYKWRFKNPYRNKYQLIFS